MNLNKSNTDKYIINPLITGATAAGLTMVALGNFGDVPFMGDFYKPATVVGLCAMGGSLVASAIEDPVRNAPALKQFGELTDTFLQPTLVGVCTMGVVFALVGMPKTAKALPVFFGVGAASEVAGSYFAAGIKSAM